MYWVKWLDWSIEFIDKESTAFKENTRHTTTGGKGGGETTEVLMF